MTSTEIAVRENGQVAGRDVVDGWLPVASDVIKLANVIAETEFVPAEYRDSPPAVAAAILTGRELGIGPMMSLRHVQLVKGVPTLSAEYKRARVLAAGHDFEVMELTTQRCKVRGRRAGASKWLEITFTMDDARTAQIVKDKGAWKTRPRRMLFARAGSELCDFIFADVTNGLPTAELVAEGADDDEFAGYNESAAQAPPGNGAAPAEGKPRTAQRRRQPAQEPADRPTAAAPAAPLAPTTGPAPAATAPSGDLPPLPGEDEPSSEVAKQEERPAKASSGQVGIIQSHFKRLDFGEDERDARLSVTEVISGHEDLKSTKDLTQDEARTVADTLSRCKNRDALIALLAAVDEARDG
jgi:hypothetical protein